MVDIQRGGPVRLCQCGRFMPIDENGKFLPHSKSYFSDEPCKGVTETPADNRYIAYIRRIRNMAKRDYAQRYYTWLCAGSIGEPPERGGLSYMAAQAVRMEFTQLHLP